LIPRHTVPRPESNIIVTDHMGRVEEWDCIHCVHCSMVMKVGPGAGKRGFCMNCMGPLCGKTSCLTTCTPIDKVIYGD
jgi:hypothetical protein